MKYAVLIATLILASGAIAQPKPKSTTVRKPAAAKARAVAKPTPLTEKEQFDKASGHELAADRVAALENYLAAHPVSENRSAAADLLVSSRALIAEEKLLSGQTADAVAIFKQVVADAPQPVPNDMFVESIAKIPTMLFRHGQREAAFDLANQIEAKVDSSPAQLIEVANFYISIENGGEAMRVAAKAAAKDQASAAIYRTLALAHRINFDLESSADAYAKAVELEPDSLAAKRGLADMKRALGKSDEAVSLYRELLAKNEADVPARNGLVLALFDAGKRTEAEAELTAALEKSPGNFILMSGAAYWYASQGLGDKAVELAEKALKREPRYVWSHIALARGLMAKGRPAQAEQVLFRARAHGNFPTLEYEIASARAAAGFYREAVEDLSKHFSIAEGGVRTNLGGRVARLEKSLPDLVAYERRAGIFTPVAADSSETAAVLKALLEFDQKIQSTEPNEAEVAAAADAFVRGSDKMKLHRQLYAASLLLQKRIAVAKALELTKAATGTTDAALEVGDAGAAVMASELYDSRSAAFRKNEVLLVPEVPKPMLSAILRGRIEELTGLALYHQGSYSDAVVRFRRAITVMPDKSAWWRSSLWRLGMALAAEGKDAEALTAYIDSYKTDKPDYGKYIVVESLYRKVNGSTEGLEAKIGAERVAGMQATPEVRTPVESPVSSTISIPAPSITESQPAESKPQTTEAKIPKAPEEKTTDMRSADEKPVEKVVDIKPSEARPVESAPIQQPVAQPTEATTEPPVVEKKIEPRTETKTVEAKRIENKPVESKPVETKPETSGTEVNTGTPEPKPVETKPASTEKAEPNPAEKKPLPEETHEVKTDDTPPTAKPDPKPEDPPDTEAAAPKPEEQTSSNTTQPPAKNSSTVNSKSEGPKLLFEPIIITIPSRPRKVPTQTSITGETTGPSKKDDTADGSARARWIESQTVQPLETAPCRVGLSQDQVSVINSGGRVGIFVNVDEPGDIKSLVASASSPKDIDVTLDPEMSGTPGRSFFVIKSTSAALGVYQVTFATPCGKSELIVRVR